LERCSQDLARFVSLLPDHAPLSLPIEAQEYNRLTHSVRSRASDYLSLALHLAGHIERDGLSKEALLKLNLFEIRGRFAIFDDETALKERYLNLMLGAGVIPAETDPMLSAISDREIEAAFNRVAGDVAKIVSETPKLSELLERLRKAHAA
jgi:hypothetical protein